MWYNLKIEKIIKSIHPSHNEFLLQLFKESRPDLGYMNGLNEEQKETIILQQFTIEINISQC